VIVNERLISQPTNNTTICQPFSRSEASLRATPCAGRSHCERQRGNHPTPADPFFAFLLPCFVDSLILCFVDSMLLAITSDSHDNLVNIKKFTDYCNTHKVALVIHCGDVTEKDTEKFFIKNLKAKIMFVGGNADIVNQEKFKRTNRFQKIKHEPIPFLDLTIDNIKIAACHTREKAKRLALSKKFDIVFYGHNHKPWQEKLERSYLVNPGNLAGLFYRASFATYDTKTKKLNLIILDQLR